jgi:predicted transcriptional regulator
MSKRDIADAELAILQLLWDDDRLTVRQITQNLYPKQTSSDLATVQKLIQRLEKKGLVARDRTHFVHFIFAKISRHEFGAQRLAETAEKLTGGSLKPLLTHLVETERLSPDELDEIRKLLNRHRRKH